MEKKQLISVIVAQYNSEKYIIETLNSIFNQDYSEVELIICDDASKDSSLDVVYTWLGAVDTERFSRVELVCSKENRGLTKNLNSGIQIARGEWIKCIAADDLLCKKCLTILHKEALDENAQIVFGQAQAFKSTDAGNKEFLFKLVSEDIKKLFNCTQRTFFYELIEKCFLPAPSSFFSRSLWEEYGGFETNYIMMEDWPFWLKLAESNVRFYFIDEVVVLYRIHDQSITSNKLSAVNSSVGLQAKSDAILFSYIYRKKHIKGWINKWEIVNTYFTSKIPKRKRPIFIYKLLYFFFRITSPVFLFSNILKGR